MTIISIFGAARPDLFVNNQKVDTSNINYNFANSEYFGITLSELAKLDSILNLLGLIRSNN